jgi:CRP-like cAMP-binding protein
MNAPLPSHLSFETSGLQRAIASSQSLDTLELKLPPAQWSALAQFIQPCSLQAGQVLMEQGANDRSVYMVETGTLSAHLSDSKGRVRIAMVGPGSVVGESAFFSFLPRLATVQAASDSKLWCLTPMRYVELANRQPALALALVNALGTVLARRHGNKPKRTAIT